MPEFVDTNELRRRVTRVLQSSGLDDAGVLGTQTNIMIEAFIARLGELGAINEENFINHYTQNSTGFYLDFRGEERALTRRSASPAVVFASDRNLKFYTERGNLRDKLGPTIPNGTEVTNSDGRILFLVNETSIPAGVSEVFVAASSQNLGPSGNVGSNVLTQHSLQVDDVLVTNLSAISTGRNTEPDKLFRQRLLSHMRGTISITPEEIIAQVLGLPGVVNARYLPYAFGITHPAIMLSGPDKLTNSTIAQAEAITSPFLPFGTRLTFLIPDYVDVDVSIAVRHNGTGNASALKSTIQNFVRNLIRNLNVGTTYDFTQLDSEITRRYSEVINVEITEIRINGKLHSNRRVRLREHEQMLVSSTTVELLD